MKTSTLLERLQARGLKITRQMLAKDVKRGFLPGPALVGRGPRKGTEGEWDDRVLDRATYLYRLRKRGLKGDALRVLLFWRDGWGWDGIKDVALAGFDKGVEVTQTGVYETVRKPTPESLGDLVDYAAQAQERRLIDRLEPDGVDLHVNANTMGFVWGQGLFGSSLPRGTLESLAPIGAFLNPEVGEAAPLLTTMTEIILTASGLTWAGMRQIITDADATIANEARLNIQMAFFNNLRKAVRRASVAEGKRNSSSNPFTLFGRLEQSVHDGFWSNSPGRITPAQWLGSQVAIGILTIQISKIALGNLLEALMPDASLVPTPNTDSAE